MAKLNGVTTVSERIQYSGADYVKSAEVAVVGDIIRLDGTSRYINTGAFYEVTRIDSHDDPQIIDEESDEYDTCGDDFTVFKRVEAAVAVDSDVITYEGAKYRKVARKANVGDLAIRTSTGGCEYKTGQIFRVDTVSCDGSVTKSGTSTELWQENYAVLESIVAAQPSATQYREVKRKANVGERIRIVNPMIACDYGMGDEFGVTSVGADGTARFTDKVGDDNCAVIDEYVVLEPVTSVEPTPYEPQSGDKVRSRSGTYTLGKRAPENDGIHGKLAFWLKETDERTWLGEGQFDVIEKADAKQPQQEEPRLKVGEYAKVIGSKHGNFFGGTDGEIVEIIGESRSTLKCKRVDGYGYEGDPWANAGALVRATEAEVAEAQKAALVAQRRNVKVGDYVKITKSQYAAPVGTIVKVTKVYAESGTITYEWEGNGGGWGSNFYEPVTPAEAEQARKEQAEAAKQDAERTKWSAIGRKVGEIKVGDIVRTTGSSCGHPIGTIGEVVYDPSLRNLRVKANGEVKSHHGQLELVAPVGAVVNVDAKMADTSRR